MMADSGAAYTCIRPEDATHLQRSGNFARTIGFSGQRQLIPTSCPVELKYSTRTVVLPVLISENTPVALLGRDAMCKLGCTIKCSRYGCTVDMLPTYQMPLFSPKILDIGDPTVWWLGDLSSSLMAEAKKWAMFLEINTPGGRKPDYPPHLTLQYHKKNSQIDPNKWLLQQPKTVPIFSESIVLGPAGAAMTVRLDDYLRDQYTIQGGVPHVTLRLGEGYESMDVAEMMKRAATAKFYPHPDNTALSITSDQKLVKILVQSEGTSAPQVVKLLDESLITEPVPRSLKDQMLEEVPDELWSKYPTDIGFIKSATPVKVRLRPGATLPWKPQYPLKPEAVEGIEPQITGLLKAGVLRITTTPKSNTPLLPIQKPDKSYRLVHDLRAVNAVLETAPNDVPDPYLTFTQIPSNATHYCSIDLSQAYFSCPLSEECQDYFGFTFKGQYHTYQRLPQGLSSSPFWFNKILREDLTGLENLISSTVIMYMDDLLVCGDSEAACHRDSITLLKLLHDRGHKVSLRKLQWVQESVVYLGHKISRGHRSISDEHIQAIREMPRPQSVRQMMRFLGMCNYSASWVSEFTRTVEPLRKMIKSVESDNLQAAVIWTPEGDKAFEDIKRHLIQAPALTLPDYSKPFLLFCSTSGDGQYACAVLAQNTHIGNNPQPIAFYCIQYSVVEMGFAPCFRALGGVYLAYEKASAITMGYPVTIYTHHSVRNLLNHSKFTLTEPRIRDYYRLVDSENVTLLRCETINPASLLPTPTDGTPHECLEEVENYKKLRSDLQATPLANPEIELWTDGSCHRINGQLRAGYAIIQSKGKKFEVVKSELIPQPCSAQRSELIALKEACLLAAGKRASLYSDSAYAISVCMLHGTTWKNRGFQRTDGEPLKHHKDILNLLEAMMKPKELSITKVAAHRSDSSRITAGNRAADTEARRITGALHEREALLMTHEAELEDYITLEEVAKMQEEAAEPDKTLWIERGASKDEDGLWRNHEGLIIAPPTLLPLLILEGHGLAHASRTEVKRRITQEFGYWAPYLLQQIDHYIGRCAICLQNNIRPHIPTIPGYVPIPEGGPMSHLLLDYCDMVNRVEGKRYLLVITDRYTRWIEATPTRHKDAKSVAKFLCREVISRFGFPRILQSDNGKEFVDKTFKLTLQMMGIKQRLGCVYHSQSQGLTERANSSLKSRLLKICQQTKLNWLAALPLALMACRSSAIRQLKLTPHELLTARPMNAFPLRSSGKGPSMSLLDEDLRAYVKHMKQIHRNINKFVKDQQEEEVKDLQKVRTMEIKPGDQVYLKIFRRKWFNNRREGPFTVTQSIGNAIRVQGSDTWYHLSHCIKAPPDSQTGDVENTPNDPGDTVPSPESHPANNDQRNTQIDASENAEPTEENGNLKKLDLRFIPTQTQTPPTPTQIPPKPAPLPSNPPPPRPKRSKKKPNWQKDFTS